MRTGFVKQNINLKKIVGIKKPVAILISPTIVIKLQKTSEQTTSKKSLKRLFYTDYCK
jgi:hypothetical protein